MPKLLGDDVTKPRRSDAPAPPDSDTVTPPSNLEATQPTVVESYDGQGGSFILDSTTGQRTLVHQTLPPSI